MIEFVICSNKEKMSYLNHKPSAIVCSFLDWVQTLELISGLFAKKESIVTLYASNKFKYQEEHSKKLVQVSQQCPFPAVANMLNNMASQNLIETLLNLILWIK